MTNARLVLASFMSLSLGGCPSGYKFEYLPGETHVNARDVIHDLALDAEKNCAAALAPLVHCELDPLLCRLDPVTRNAVPDKVCGELRPLLTLAHLSDAQLKENRVALDGPLGEKMYDHINSAVRRNPELERYDFAVLLATVLAVDAKAAPPKPAGTAPNPYAPCPAPLPPSFVVHTGDAIDAGLFTELFEFLTIMLELDVPFYNAVGNHDNLFFGTFPKHEMGGLDVTLPFVPVGDTNRFLLAHHSDASHVDLSIPYRPSVDHCPTSRAGACAEMGENPEAPQECTVAPRGSAPRPCWGSDYFGFDLFCAIPRRTSGRELALEKLADKRMASPSFPRRMGGLCNEARGYYGQDFMLPPGADGAARKVRLLVLNTSEVGPTTKVMALEQRSHGQMREEQTLWLTRELSSHREVKTVFLVAGHHNLGGFVEDQQGALKNLLLGEARVLAYLGGHTHVSAIHRHDRRSGQALWEVISGSTLVYPQLANFVDILERPDGEIFLRVRSFRQQLSDVICDNECALRDLARRARRGAFNDLADGDRRLESVAKRRANGLLRVSSFQ